MAATTLNLNAFKRSDVYTIEIDQSQNVQLPLSTGRVVIGSSRKGPMNTVVLVTDPVNAVKVYGDIDSKLESKGSFFHRTLAVSLKQGPVYALNAIPVTSQDTANFLTWNTEFSSYNTPTTINAFTQPVSSYFNTQRFWYADSSALTSTKNRVLSSEDKTKVLSFANLSKAPVTVWAHKTVVNGYNQTAKEYYSLFGNSNGVPSFINPDDIIADYFVELIVVQGDWSNNLKLSQDPIYGQYFDKTGLIESKINQFLNLNEVTVVLRASGSLIPDFLDQSGLNASIDTIVNSTYTQTEVLCAIDIDAVDSMDLSSPDFVPADVTSQRLDVVGYGYNEIDSFVDDSTIPGVNPNPVINVLGYKKPLFGPLNFIALPLNTAGALGEDLLDNNIAISAQPYIKAYSGSPIYDAFHDGFTASGDKIVGPASAVGYIKYEDGFVDATSGANLPYTKVTAYSDIALTNQIDISTLFKLSGSVNYLNVIPASFTTDFYKTFSTTDTNFFSNVVYNAPNVLTLTLATSITTDNLNLLKQYIKVNQYLQAQVAPGTERNRLLQIISVTSNVVGNVTTWVVTTMAPKDQNVSGIDVSTGSFTAVIGLKNFVNTVRGFYMQPFVLRPALLPDGSAARENAIMDFVLSGSNLGKALADKQSVDFRYFIDSTQGTIDPASKSQLAQIAANHGQALVIANAPSIKQFINSTDPSFVDQTTGLVSAQYIAQGGNLDLNPSFTYGFAKGTGPTGVDISTYIAYFMPNLQINDGGRIKSVPSAAYVGNAYMRKFSSGNTFSVVAGKKGALNDPEIDSLEYSFTDDDRDVLEPAGFNMIVKRRGFGNIIMGNELAYQATNSALNNIHVRDALITIERDVNQILFNFLFDFNDEITQMRVRTIVQNYLDAVLAAGGITLYSVTFNSTNNTPEVIDSNTGIIDISVTFPRAIHKFINRITITRTGGQLSSNSTGFIPSF